MVVYRDEGISAKDTERPALQKLIADVRAGRVAMVLVTKLDRISRSLHDLLTLVALFEQAGVKFISVRDNIDTGGPVGRFILHILGAIAELERGITAERVAEDMKLRARRGKWNGGMAPYGRRVVDGQLQTVPDEAAVLRRMRQLFLEKRTWRGVTVALNGEGLRTRGWESLMQNGRVARKGKPPAGWTTVTVKRILLQRINEGTLVYNRRRIKGKTSVPRPTDEHIVVENYCEPIFSREEMAELLDLAAKIEGAPSRQTGSPHLLSGLIRCGCGARMYASRQYVTTKTAKYPLTYYHCRRAMGQKLCSARSMPATVIEPLVLRELRALAIDSARLHSLAGQAQEHFSAEVEPLLNQRAELGREIDRLARKIEPLLELVEDRLISKEDFQLRKSHIDQERQQATEALTAVDAALRARVETTVDVSETLKSLQRLSDVYDELTTVGEQRHLLKACLDEVVVQPGAIELHVPAYPLLVLSDLAGGAAGPVEGVDGSTTAARLADATAGAESSWNSECTDTRSALATI